MIFRKAMIGMIALFQMSAAHAQTAPLPGNGSVTASVFGIGGMQCKNLVALNSLTDKGQSTYWHVFGFVSGVFTSQAFFSRELGPRAASQAFRADEALDAYWDDGIIDKAMGRMFVLCSTYPDSSLNRVTNLLVAEIVEQYRREVSQ